MSDAALLALLSQETALVNAFMATLDQETEALGLPEAHTALDAAAQQKAVQADALRALGAQREEWLRAQGLPIGREGMQMACARNTEVAEAWEMLAALAALAATKNNANGEAIQQQMADVQERMNTLRGLQMKETGTYDARGRAKGPSTGRTLAAG